MNDKQHMSALEMSWRYIENYSDNCDVERELKESDEVTWEIGDLAIHYGNEVLVVGRHPYHPHYPAIVVESENEMYLVPINELKKPETPEEKSGS